MTDAPPRTTHPLLGPQALVVCAVLLAVVLVPLVATPARADDAAANLTGWVNVERAAAGLPALRVASDLVDVATRHAGRMASSGSLHHNPRLGAEVAGWERVTENVGRGPQARQIHDAFMSSSTHAANILDAGVTQVGVGVVWADGTLWVTQVFRRPSAAAATPPPPPGPSPQPRPDPPPAPGSASIPTVGGEHGDADGAPAVLTWDLPEVAPAPDPSSIVGPADDGQVRVAPAPDTVRVLSAAGWLVVLVDAVDG